MITRTQANRFVSVKSPLGPDALLLLSMTGQEQLSNLFRYELDLVSEQASIDTNKILGDAATVVLQMPSGQPRYFNGFVSRFTNEGLDGGYTRFRATLVPWLWLLTRTSDCRIFQEKTVPDIIKEVFRDNGFSGFDDRLTGSYRTWEYCVQYRETDFNFVSRLMEQEGIYYYFEHHDGHHVLVLADSISAHGPYPGYDTIKFFPPGGSGHRDEETVSDWSVSHEVLPGSYVHNDFDFKAPKKNLVTLRKIAREHPAADGELYDYPGEFVEYGEGETYARTRIEELHARFEVTSGAADAHGLACGYTFELDNHPDPQQNREYLVTAATYSIESDAFGTGSSGTGGQAYTCQFSAMDTKQPYRPHRVTPKPIVQGPQTAIIAGKSGEEIWTDKYGRVKVQFHWDRYGKADESASCWIRVSQGWAGKNWGAMYIPRIGQEVIVEFLEGDPDRPIITGRVYNGDNMPPYTLPSNATQSGVKTRSSKGGSPANFNEIRFEDKKGEEHLYIHAEKDQNIVVENDRSDSVGHDETVTIGNDETVTIGNDRTEIVANNEDITIGVNRTETVGSNESITIGANRTETVGQNETVTVSLMRTHTVGVNDAQTVGAAQEITVGAAQAITVGAAQAITVGAIQAMTVGKDQTFTVAKNGTYSYGKKLAITAGDEISITTGKASIVMKKDGTINISGKDITINGTGKITAKASKNMILKGKKILEN